MRQDILPPRYAFICLAVLLVAAIACGVPPAPMTPTLTSAPGTNLGMTSGPGLASQPPAVTDAPLPTATATTPPAAAPTATPPVPTGEVPYIALGAAPDENATFEGISFHFDLDLFSAWTSEIVPPPDQSSGEPVDWLTPSHYRFDFQGYPVANELHQPTIFVIPAENYQNFGSGVGQREIDRLVELLTVRQPDAWTPGRSLPMLPIYPAAQGILAQVAYVEFQSGIGLRYLTQLGQAVWPINNYNLFYTFQGLTHDRRYYVAVFLPISHPGLPGQIDVNNMPQDFRDAETSGNYDAYYQSKVDQLNAALPGDFRPDLSQLDALVQSIRVER